MSIAIIRDDTDEIVWAMQVEHRGQSIIASAKDGASETPESSRSLGF